MKVPADLSAHSAAGCVGMWDNFVGLSIIQQPTAAPGHPDWDGQADARRPRPWLAPGMWHPRIPLSSRMSRAARAASPVRDPPGAALTWVRRCLAVWEGRERAYHAGCLREAAGAELRRGRALGGGDTGPGICVRSAGDAIRTRSYDANPRL